MPARINLYLPMQAGKYDPRDEEKPKNRNLPACTGNNPGRHLRSNVRLSKNPPY
jgi:hypothetical protein